MDALSGMVLSMPYTHNRRSAAGFVIDDPDGDRPYFCHRLPLEYVKEARARGARVYAFELVLRRGGVQTVLEVLAPGVEANSIVTDIPWRGSVSDLATDLRAALSPDEICALIKTLLEPPRGV